MSSTLSYLVVLFTISSLVAAGPCDIYAAGGTPCIAAHSTTRALFSAYDGPLYQIARDDGTTADINTISGIADANSQDSFCGNSTCLISIIYDQSGQENHLTMAQAGGFPGPGPNGSDNLANAGDAPVFLKGSKVYGVLVNPGTGYRNNQANGTATGDGPQGIYAVLDGTNFNNLCCFDYGNAERDSTDTGNGHMEAIYFGNNADFGSGADNGPWIMADLENGLFAGSDLNNPQNPSITSRFVTAVVKGQPGNWAIRGGDASSGDLNTFFNGARPAGGYDPMVKEGSIILGIGGDNSNGGKGTFYEGVMTSGFPSDDTENSVQADIVAAGYAANPPSNPDSDPGSTDPNKNPDGGPGGNQGTGGSSSGDPEGCKQ